MRYEIRLNSPDRPVGHGRVLAYARTYRVAKRFATELAWEGELGVVVRDTVRGITDNGDGWYDDAGRSIPAPRYARSSMD